MDICCKRSTARDIDAFVLHESHISYVYCIVDTKTRCRYVGKRTAVNRKHQDPRLDLGVAYFTSSRDEVFLRNFKERPQQFRACVLHVSDDPQLISRIERTILTSHNAAHNHRFYNRHNANSGISTLGLVPVIVKADNSRTLISSALYHDDKDQYISHHSNTVCMVNQETNNSQRISLDEYQSNPKIYKSHMHNRLWVWDKVDSVHLWVSSEEYGSNKPRYSKSSENKVVVIDHNNNHTMIPKDEYDPIKHRTHNKGTLTAYDKETNTYVKIKSSDYNPSKHSTHSSGVVYVYGEKGEELIVSTDEYRLYKHKYQLRRPTIFRCFNIVKDEWENVEYEIYKQNPDGYITVRSKIIKIFEGSNLIDVTVFSDLNHRYNKDTNIITPGRITKMYKQEITMTFDPYVLSCQVEKVSAENVQLYLQFRLNSPPILTQNLTLYKTDSNEQHTGVSIRHLARLSRIKYADLNKLLTRVDDPRLFELYGTISANWVYDLH